VVTCFFGTQCSAAGTRRRLLNSTVVTMDDETVQMKQLPDNEFNNTQTTESTQTDRQTDRQTSLAAWSSLAFGEVEDQGNWDDDVDSSCHTWRADADCDSSYMCHTCHTMTLSVTLDEQMLTVTLLTCVTPVTQCHTVTLSVTQWRADADCDSSYMCHTCHTMSHSDEQMLIVTLLTCVTPVTQCH